MRAGEAGACNSRESAPAEAELPAGGAGERAPPAAGSSSGDDSAGHRPRQANGTALRGGKGAGAGWGHVRERELVLAARRVAAKCVD